MATSVTPMNQATKALLESSSEALLDAIVQLTHRIHGLTSTGATQVAMARAHDLRWQRDMLRAEVLRRIGDQR